MLSFFDIILKLLTGILCFFVSSIILIGSDKPFLFFIPMLFYLLVQILLKRRKKIAKYLKDDFKKMGYNVLSERPPRFSEITLEIKPAILINGIPASRYSYIRKFARIFEVETEPNERFELNTIVKKHWNGKNSIDIKKKTEIK